MATMECPQCGKSIDVTHSFCPNCGAQANNIQKAAAGLETLVKLGDAIHRHGPVEVSGVNINEPSPQFRDKALSEHCRKAVCLGEERIVGDRKTSYSPEYAPYKAENLPKWERAAELGILDGIFLFGNNLCDKGRQDEGLAWLEKAARQGHRPAKRCLGTHLVDSGDAVRGISYLQEAADENDPEACWTLANYYREGKSVARSTKRYRHWMKKAVKYRHHLAILE